MNPMTSDMCQELWGELEFAAMRRQVFARHCCCVFPTNPHSRLPYRDLAELDILLSQLLGRGFPDLIEGRRVYVKPSDSRWRQ